MRLVATRKPQQNRAAIDPWTAVHLSAGLALGLMAVPLRAAMAASLLYEVAEQVAERRRWGQQLFKIAGPESLPNAVTDSVVFFLGHRLGARWNGTGTARG